jgi:hypothetical protein
LAKRDRTTQVNFELPPDVLAQVKACLEERGWTLKHFFTRAAVRHMGALPPIVPEPPLKPCEADRAAAKPAAKRGRKPSGK